MRKPKKRNEDQWPKIFGEHLRSLIEKKGYVSPYDFWVQACGEDISRATLDNILNGRFDFKISTLRKLANALEISMKSLLDHPDL